MSEKKTISVMIPCYNEEQNARPIYEAVRDELVKSCPNYDYEILFIDNKSEDGTRAIIRQICAEDKHVKAIFNVKNFGQFNSPYYGMIHTSGDCTITMCADFQDPVEMIPRFVAEWEKGYKIVIGRKTQSKENPVMYWLRGCYYKLIKKMSSCEQIEQFTGFGLYDKSLPKNPGDLTERQSGALETLRDTDPRGQLYRSWQLKELLRTLPHQPAGQAEAELKRWIFRASHSRIPEAVELCRKIRRRRDDILGTIGPGYSNARLEAFNNKIKATIRMAYGFRHVDNLIAMIKLRCSGLTTHLPTPTL